MREKNRKPIASYIKLPQFTTMNVIDGQAGLIIYASLIFYSLTIDNILNIIVLLILAGVTIATLTGDNGILKKVGEAKNNTIDSEIEEQIKLAYQDYQMAKYSENEYTLQNALAKTGLNITSVEGDDSIGYEVTVNTTNGKKIYELQSNGTVRVASTEWTDNGDGSWTKGIRTIQIGDVVNYDPTKDVNGNTLTTTYTSYGTANAAADKNSGRTSGYRSDQEFSVRANTNGWKVLGINESGKIELISAFPIRTVRNNGYVLRGEKGYLDGPNELNAICSIFGQGKGAESARSLNSDDTDKLAGIKTDADKIARSPGLTYGFKYQFRYPTEEEKIDNRKCMQYRTDAGSGFGSWTNITPSNFQKFKIPGEDYFGRIDGSNIVEGFSSEITRTSYWYCLHRGYGGTYNKALSNVMRRVEDLFHVGNFWLASRVIWYEDYYLSFEVRFCMGDHIDNQSLFRSYGQEIDTALNVRPVVTLNSTVRLVGDSERGWTIQ